MAIGFKSVKAAWNIRMKRRTEKGKPDRDGTDRHGERKGQEGFR